MNGSAHLLPLLDLVTIDQEMDEHFHILDKLCVD